MNTAFARLLLMCGAFAVGEAAAYAVDARSVGSVVGLILAIAAYVFTQDSDRPRRGGRGEMKYWRGRRVDDEDGPRRLN